MRVMINTLAAAGAETGGGHTVISHLVRHLARIDPDNEYVLVVTSRNRPGFETGAPNVRLLTLPELVDRAPVRLLVDNVMLPRLARRQRVDVFFAPNDALPPGLSCRAVVGALNLIYHQPRAIMRWPGASPWERWRLSLQWRYYGAKTPRAMRRADRVIAISEETRREVIANTPGIDPGRVRVIYPGVPSAFGAPVAGGARVAADSPYVLTTGAVVPYKNLDKLIMAFARLRRRGGTLSRLVVVGRAPYPSYRRVLDAVVGREGVSGAVEFRGFVPTDELAALYRGARVFALLSSCESFGFPVLEAMACGTPVVVSNRSSLPEVVGDAGLTVDPDDVEAVARTLGRVLEDDDVRADLARRCRARAESFSWERAATETQRVFREAYASDRRGYAPCSNRA